MMVKMSKSSPCIICGRGCAPGSKKRKEVTSTPPATAQPTKFFKLFERHVSDGGGGSGVGACGDSNSNDDEDGLLTTMVFEKLINVNQGSLLCCEECSKIVESFCELYHEMKSIELKVNWTVGELQKLLGVEVEMGKEKTFEKVEGQVKAIQGFRRDLSKKCNRKLQASFPRLILNNCRPTPKEPATPQDGHNAVISSEVVFEPEDPSPPRSPSNSIDADVRESVNSSFRLRSVHRCPKCRKTFSNPKKLEEHQRSHEDDDWGVGDEESEGGADDDFNFNIDDEDNKTGVEDDLNYSGPLEDSDMDSEDSQSQTDAEGPSCPTGTEGVEDEEETESATTGNPETAKLKKPKTEAETYPCSLCGKGFGRWFHLMRHLMTVHSKRKSSEPLPASNGAEAAVIENKCILCGMGFGTVPHLRRHYLNIHHPKKSEVGNESKFSNLVPDEAEGQLSSINSATGMHKCSLCPDKEFKSPYYFREHYHSVHRNLSHLCDICGKSFRYRKSYWQHREVAHGGRRYKCHKCSRTFTQPGGLRLHQRISSCTAEGGREEPMTTCHICGKQVKRMNFKKHLRLVHEKVREHLCKLCGNKFAGKWDLVRHRREVHQVETPRKSRSSNGAIDKGQYSVDPDTGKFSCTICPNKLFKTVHYFQDHWKSIHLNLTHNCDLCPKTFRHRKAYWQHRNVFHGGHRYSCESCGKTFTQSSGLRVHRRTTSCAPGGEQEPPVPCHICGKMFERKGNLQIHLKFVHEKVREHGCPQCGKKFSLLTKLQRHIEGVHEKKRDHKCEQCGAAFLNKGHLKRHAETVHAKKDAVDRSTRSISKTSDEDAS